MNKKNREGFRKCSCCKEEKELITINFCSDKNRPFGFSYRCRVCDSSKKDTRRERYKKLSLEDKEKHKKKNRDYCATFIGRAVSLLSAYRKIDREKGQICDLDKTFLINEIFLKTCIYCEDTEKIGCDRIDNSIGHIKSNVVPCCYSCNTTRMNNYSHEEMLILGKTIKTIKLLRNLI